MSAPRITALINTYNYGRFVGEAIESVLAQDFPASELEVLVVDDGSTDDTRDVVARFGDHVRYLYKPNGGQATAFNLGCAEARGEIIAFLDGDDLWLPGKLRRVVEEFNRQPEAGMVYHAFEYWDVTRGTRWKDESFPAVSGFVPASERDLLLYGDVSTSGMALRRAALESLLPVPETLRILADGYLGYLAIFVAPVVAVNEHLTRYRIHGGNLCTFAEGDRWRLEQRVSCSAEVARQVRLWLERRFGPAMPPGVAAYIRRHELVTERVRFEAFGARRHEFYAHLRETRKLYGRAWSARYRALQWALSFGALALGYGGYQKLRSLYRRSAMNRLRERMLPALQPGAFDQGGGASS